MKVSGHSGLREEIELRMMGEKAELMRKKKWAIESAKKHGTPARNC